jgi:hypothetical protein
MGIELARIGFYVVAFFIVMVMAKMLIDKAQDLKMNKMFSKQSGNKDKEDPFK